MANFRIAKQKLSEMDAVFGILSENRLNLNSANSADSADKAVNTKSSKMVYFPYNLIQSNIKSTKYVFR